MAMATVDTDRRPPSGSSVRRSRLHRRVRSRGFYGVLLALLLCGIVVAVLMPSYYDWVLSGETMEVEVLCHSEPLHTADLQVTVFYDKLALSPLPRYLGLYQNRPSAEVHSLHAHTVAPSAVRLKPYALILADVPEGPIVKISCRTADRLYMVSVRDRVPRNGRLLVRAGRDHPETLYEER